MIEPYFDQALRAAQGSIEKLLPSGKTLSVELSRPDSMTLLGVITASGGDTQESNGAYFIQQGVTPKRVPPFTKGSKIKRWVEHKLDSHFGTVNGPAANKRGIVATKLANFIANKIESNSSDDSTLLERGWISNRTQSEAIISKGISDAMEKIFV